MNFHCGLPVEQLHHGHYVHCVQSQQPHKAIRDLPSQMESVDELDDSGSTLEFHSI